MTWRRVVLFVLLLAGARAPGVVAAATPPVATIQLEGVIRPVTVRLLEAALTQG